MQQACNGDGELQQAVESLLLDRSEAETFLETPLFPANRARSEVKLIAGQRIGPYKLLQELGHGGMGAVWLAARADEQYQKRVAIKLIKRGMDTEEILNRFRYERQILASLEHPNIARLLDGGTTPEGLPYFVMEHIEGQPIDEFCNTRGLATIERLKLFRIVCAAVQFAHQNLVVHRELKPNNILVTADGTVKLLDFGIAKTLKPEFFPETIAPTAAYSRPMTPAYASPEQVRGQAITTASDVYSLGVILYQLLTGQRPYELTSASPQEIERVICEQEPRRPSLVDRAKERQREGAAARQGESLPRSFLVQAIFELNNMTRAEELTREALAIRRKALGEEAPDVALNLHNLGALLRRKGYLPHALDGLCDWQFGQKKFAEAESF